MSWCVLTPTHMQAHHPRRGLLSIREQLFSDLTHYVRSGDFLVNLVAEATTLDEYAFALGALAHYAADTQGHGIAVNRSVALGIPQAGAEIRKDRDLRRRQGVPRPGGIQL